MQLSHHITVFLILTRIQSSVCSKKISSELKNILLDLSHAHIYFSYFSVTPLEQEYLKLFCNRSLNSFFLNKRNSVTGEKKNEKTMTTKYTNQFIYVSFIAAHLERRAKISTPTDLSKFYSGGFRNPKIALYIAKYFDFRKFSNLHFKSTILAASFEKIWIICPICEKLNQELETLKNIPKLWRRVFETESKVFSLTVTIQVPYWCNLLLNG